MGKLVLKHIKSEPISPKDGDLWYDSTKKVYRVVRNGKVVTISRSEAIRLFQRGQK